MHIYSPIWRFLPYSFKTGIINSQKSLAFSTYISFKPLQVSTYRLNIIFMHNIHSLDIPYFIYIFPYSKCPSGLQCFCLLPLQITFCIKYSCIYLLIYSYFQFSRRDFKFLGSPEDFRYYQREGFSAQQNTQSFGNSFFLFVGKEAQKNNVPFSSFPTPLFSCSRMSRDNISFVIQQGIRIPVCWAIRGYQRNPN